MSLAFSVRSQSRHPVPHVENSSEDSLSWTRLLRGSFRFFLNTKKGAPSATRRTERQFFYDIFYSRFNSRLWPKFAHAQISPAPLHFTHRQEIWLRANGDRLQHTRRRQAGPGGLKDQGAAVCRFFACFSAFGRKRVQDGMRPPETSISAPQQPCCVCYV